MKISSFLIIFLMVYVGEVVGMPKKGEIGKIYKKFERSLQMDMGMTSSRRKCKRNLVETY